MLMPATGTTGVATQSWETALALRGMALLQPDLPKYLLAPEVAVLLSCLYDERQRMLFAFLWNTGARITEALMVTPEDLQLDGPRPFVRLRTLKQRSRGRRRPAKDEKVARVVPLLDGAFVRELHRYLATFRPGRRTPLFAVTRKTAWSWLQQAIDRADAAGIAFAVTPVSPRTLRQSGRLAVISKSITASPSGSCSTDATSNPRSPIVPAISSADAETSTNSRSQESTSRIAGT